MQHMKKVLSYIDIARQEGGVIECGGEAVKIDACDGWFIAPTVITGYVLVRSCAAVLILVKLGPFIYSSFL